MIIKSFLKIITASVIMGIAGRYILQGELWVKGGDILEKAIYFSGTMTLCIIIYFAVSYLLRNEEMHYLFAMIKNKLNRKRVSHES